jgi:hypothetical protein
MDILVRIRETNPFAKSTVKNVIFRGMSRMDYGKSDRRIGESLTMRISTVWGR